MVRRTAFFLILLAFGAALLGTATPADAAKSKPCWRQVIDDWSQDGTIDGRYSLRCIEEALDKVPEDVRAYSDFEEQAKAARQEVSRLPQSSGGGDGGGSGSGGSGGTTAPVEEREPDTGTGPKDETPVGWALGTRGNNADSVPIPLLILLGLAGALITAGAAGFGARKIRARRDAP
jgi:hypothetical protein